jgi:hypothetical protein
MLNPMSDILLPVHTALYREREYPQVAPLSHLLRLHHSRAIETRPMVIYSEGVISDDGSSHPDAADTTA